MRLRMRHTLACLLFAAVCCFIYVVLIRKQKLVPKQEGPKYLGAIFETAGQFAYIFAQSFSYIFHVFFWWQVNINCAFCFWSNYDFIHVHIWCV